MPTPHAPWLPLPVAARPTAASRGRPTPHTHSPAVLSTCTDPPASRQPHAAPHPGGGARRTRATSHGPADRQGAPAPLRRPTAPLDVCKQPSATGLDCAANGGLPAPHRPTSKRTAPSRRTGTCAVGVHDAHDPLSAAPRSSPSHMHPTRRPAILRPTGLSGPPPHLGYCRGPPAASSPWCSEAAAQGGSPARPSPPPTEGWGVQMY
jgi:hypothetical protein